MFVSQKESFLYCFAQQWRWPMRATDEAD